MPIVGGVHPISLGLRAMYFLLVGMAEKFALLKYGLAAILLFIGLKMTMVDFIHIPVAISLGVVALILVTTLVASVWINRKNH